MPHSDRLELITVNDEHVAKAAGQNSRRGSIRRRGNSVQMLVYAGVDPMTGQRMYLSDSITDEAEAKRS